MTEKFNDDKNGRDQISQKNGDDNDGPDDHNRATDNYLNDAHEKADEVAGNVVLAVHRHKNIHNPNAQGQRFPPTNNEAPAIGPGIKGTAGIPKNRGVKDSAQNIAKDRFSRTTRDWQTSY